MTKATRESILTAARDLMRDRGYAGMTMQELADRVGILKGSLYSRIGGKEDLVPEVLALTAAEAFGDMRPSGDWRADYDAALSRLVALLSAGKRCVGLHLAYGLGSESPAVHGAIHGFFDDVIRLFERLIGQKLDADLARALAHRTLILTEGATLWLALDNDPGPIRQVQATLRQEADALAVPLPDPAARKLLDEMMGDWRRATATEKRLAERLAAAESGAG